MDTTDDLAYLNYLGDKNDTFLLQSTDEALGVQDPTLNTHTIFGELDDGARIWTIDNLPVLLNGSVITEDQSEKSPVGLEPQIILSELEQTDNSPNTCIESNESLSYPIEIPGEAFITSNSLFLTNEVLLQMNVQNEVHATVEETQSIAVQNNNTREIFLNKDNNNMYKVKSKVSNTNFHTNIVESQSEKVINVNDLTATADVIQLLNTDGTIINIDKNVLINNKTVNPPEPKRNQINEQFEKITAYKCKKCGYLSETLTNMYKHTSRKLCEENIQPIVEPAKPKGKSLLNVNDLKNKQKLVFLCSECNQGYCTTAELKDHMIMAHQLICGQNKIKDDKAKDNCKDPNRDTKKQEYLSIIKSQQKESRKVKCSIKGCDLRFALDEYRIRHEKCHVNSQKKQFKCPACDKTFSIWRMCSLHLWKCHEIDVGLLSCVVCNYKTFSPHKLLPHMLIHEETRQYLCNECGKGFKQFTQLRNHLVLHMANGEGAPNWICQQRCNICGNIFSDSKSLKKHIQGVHNKFKPYVCNICGHKTARKAMLELHFRQHTGEKPYVCQLCTYRTGDHNSLRRHLMRHSGGKKYSCPHCNYQSIQSVAFKQHILQKHPGANGIFRCNDCNFHTVNENVYKTHVKQHKNNEINGNKEKEKSDNADKNGPPKGTVVNGEATRNAKVQKLEDDEETQHGFLTSINNDETVDTGGITIPAGLELQI